MDKRELRYISILAGIVVLVVVAGLVLMIVQTIQKQNSDNRQADNVASPTDSADEVQTYEQGQAELAANAAAGRRRTLLEEFDLSNLTIKREQILHGGPGKDGIRALVNPERIPIAEVNDANASQRVIGVSIGKSQVAYPIDILIAHEIVNDVVDGVPIAVIYCPLCDSASVVDRRVDDNDTVLEFGVSGLLLNSNVLMYDRTDDALWSQLGFAAISGPHAGTVLESLPMNVQTLAAFRAMSPNGAILKKVLQRDLPIYATARGSYSRYFESDDISFPVEFSNDALPAKTLGIGIAAGKKAWFIPLRGIDDFVTIETPLGMVRIEVCDRGFEVTEKPTDILVVQTFFHSWAGFHPEVKILKPTNPQSDE